MALVKHWQVILLVAAGLALLLGANLYLVMVALDSQPACLPHHKPGAVKAEAGYSAATSTC